MTKLFLIAASAVLTVAGTPASAIAREPGATAMPPEQSPTATSRAERPGQRYCIVATVTGSRIPYKTCQTRGAWLKEGFDPLDPDK